jgi:5-methylcytosine-specific restriction endonuclease McrA
MVLGGCGPSAATRDHVVPRAAGGKTNANVVAACWACNQAKAARSVNDFLGPAV